MKKSVCSMLAAGALAMAGAASAQGYGDIVGYLPGGVPVYASPGGAAATPPAGQGYLDRWGRQIIIDHHGRHVLVQPGSIIGSLLGYAEDGRPVYADPAGVGSGYRPYAYSHPRWDRDGDGVANRRDRWPHDPRYW